ncbi:helix-turn-helix transcriptional regulator [Sphaerisporangium aureirubrum]|uniref:Helix-turn-helix transcriptional regulator n=1 Tax=Sphaerisporangium aureirubrum TaxID=1544736 RepID=A0ABW1NRA8_9ACTN
MSESNELGVFLRSRRDLVRPEEAGLGTGGRRRVPGLRRDEVAQLAGISAEYYLRLEQGRDRHPSAQVVDALARVLGLDEEGLAELRRLARPVRRRAVRRQPERVPCGLRELVMSRLDIPAMVVGRYKDVLVANPLAAALYGVTCGFNVLHATFLDPGVRALYEDDWEKCARSLVASVRALTGPEIRDSYLAELVGELAVRSEEFRRLWARHDIRPRTSGVLRLRHPQVGPMELNFEKLAVAGSDGQILMLFHAAPGSPAAESIALLGHLIADTAPDATSRLPAS